MEVFALGCQQHCVDGSYTWLLERPKVIGGHALCKHAAPMAQVSMGQPVITARSDRFSTKSWVMMSIAAAEHA
jgi:hypothetical protein